MPRNVSQAVRTAVFSQETDEAFLILLTIDHENLSNPIRVSSDGVDTVSRGDTYTAFPFKITLPDESEDIKKIQLTIDNVDQQIVTTIRQLTSPPTVDMEVVLSSDTDTVEAGPFSFRFTDINYTKTRVEGSLTIPAVHEARFPADRFSPNEFPGLFSGV